LIHPIKEKTNNAQNLKEFLSKLSQNLTQNYFVKIQTQLNSKQEFILVKFYSVVTNYLASFYDLTNKNQQSNKYLSDLLDRLLLSQSNNNISVNNENSFISIIRLKYAYNLLSLHSKNDLLQICEKKFQNFEYKLFNMGVSFYLLHDDNSQKKSIINENEEEDDNDVDNLDQTNLIKNYFKNLFEKYNLFKQLNIKIDSSVELMLNDLIFKYSFRFKLIEV
jgi:hypothetical protein